jgi:hypothetical protein
VDDPVARGIGGAARDADDLVVTFGQRGATIGARKKVDVAAGHVQKIV